LLGEEGIPEAAVVDYREESSENRLVFAELVAGVKEKMQGVTGTIFALKLEGYESDDIAEKVEISPRAVRRRITEIRLTVQTFLQTENKRSA
jgi:DNA-directed RNA polymerase specialized sigma24 family protein